jgi:GntR family transcriptional regulator
VVDSINNMVLRGVFPPDYQLPSVRQLAVDIGINPNTIQKAMPSWNGMVPSTL